jgi:UDP-GlcNAc3NAcA epimerase
MKIVTVVGARPQFIKAAAVSRYIRRYNKENFDSLNEIIIHTGQHYDKNMSEVFFEELEIPTPQYNLGVGSTSHGKQTGEMLESIEKVLQKENPELVLVYGDTNSTLAGALAASKLHIPIAHVEAGLRSFNKKMPEEINRILTDHVSTYLFCPTLTSIRNLNNEGFKDNLYLVGDVMYDCMLFYKEKIEKQKTTLNKFGLESQKYILATVHRAENTDDIHNLTNIFEAFNEISKFMPIFVALHPRTRKYISEYKIKVENQVKLLDPLSYLEMIELELNAYMILTDSGGVQKEAYFVETPCITLREQTEWVETVECGANVLSSPVKETILSTFEKMSNKNYSDIFKDKLYGEGNASEKIVSIITKITRDN